MEENSIQEDKWYRERDLMNTKKKLLYQKLMDEIRKQQGELAYFLHLKDTNHEKYIRYNNELTYITSTAGDLARKEWLEKKLAYIDQIQGDILRILQTMYHQLFDKVSQEIPLGPEYNEELRSDIRFDLIFGEREITGPGEGSRDTYRQEHAQKMRQVNREKKIKKNAEKREKNKDKVIPRQDHRLITKDNYQGIVRSMIPQIRKELAHYMSILGLDIKDKTIAKNTLEKFFLYILVKVLIDQKLIFETKSLRGIAFDGTIETIVSHFNEKIGESLDISLVDVKNKLQNNLKSLNGPLDLSYQNAILEDIIYRERYLNMLYFHPHGTDTNKLRIEIMAEYESGKGLIEKSFELLNPMYYAYKQQEEKHKKHLNILKSYQKKNKHPDLELQKIIEEMEASLLYAQKKKKEYTIIEDKFEKNKSRPIKSLREVQKKYMKRYRVPTQFHQIFGVIMNKNNNFYQIKSKLIKDAEKKNDIEFERYVNSPQTNKNFFLYMQLLCTNKIINTVFDKKREEKRKNRILTLKELCINPQKPLQEQKLKEAKKSKHIPMEQLSLNF